jgi:IS5 family transposase
MPPPAALSPAQAGACTRVLEQVQQQLQKHDYMARCGQIVDASLVPASLQLNKRDEADTVTLSRLVRAI